MTLRVMDAGGAGRAGRGLCRRPTQGGGAGARGTAGAADGGGGAARAGLGRSILPPKGRRRRNVQLPPFHAIIRVFTLHVHIIKGIFATGTSYKQGGNAAAWAKLSFAAASLAPWQVNFGRDGEHKDHLFSKYPLIARRHSCNRRVMSAMRQDYKINYQVERFRSETLTIVSPESSIDSTIDFNSSNLNF